MKFLTLPIFLFVFFAAFLSPSAYAQNPFGARLRPVEGYRAEKLRAFTDIQAFEKQLQDFNSLNSAGTLTEEQTAEQLEIQRNLVIAKIDALDNFGLQTLESIENVATFTTVEKNLFTNTITRLNSILVTYRQRAEAAVATLELQEAANSLRLEGNVLFIVFRSTSLITRIYEASDINERINRYLIVTQTNINRAAEKDHDVTALTVKVQDVSSTLELATQKYNVALTIITDDSEAYESSKLELSEGMGLSRSAKNALIEVVKELNVLYRKNSWEKL